MKKGEIQHYWQKVYSPKIIVYSYTVDKDLCDMSPRNSWRAAALKKFLIIFFSLHEA